jgi:hypothetical protein
VFPPFAHDSSPSQRRQQGNDRLPDRRDSIRTLVAATCYYQNVASLADLAFSQPRFHTKTRIGCSRQRFSEIENVFLTECCFVESLPDGMKGSPTGAHATICSLESLLSVTTYTAQERLPEVRKRLSRRSSTPRAFSRTLAPRHRSTSCPFGLRCSSRSRRLRPEQSSALEGSAQ